MKLLTDEHIPPALARGIRRALGEVDVLELRHTDLLGAGDPEVLDFAAREGRILITRDASTIPEFAFKRLEQGKLMPGVFIWRRRAALGLVLEDLILTLQASEAEEWRGRVVYLPFE